MSLTCPKCNHKMSMWNVPKYIRLATIMCTECKTSLRLDSQGRRGLWIPILIMLLFIVFSIQTKTGELFILGYLILGFVASAYYGDKFGTLIVEEDLGQTDDEYKEGSDS